jgi:hypothetical protein
MIDHTIDGFRYCGRYDLLAEIQHRRVLVDIKTGSSASWHVIQLAAYSLAANPTIAMVLHLKPTGAFVERYVPPAEMLGAISAWKSALVQAREEKKSKEKSALLSKSWFMDAPSGAHRSEV